MKNELIKIMTNAHSKCISLQEQRKLCKTREERLPLHQMEDEILEIFDCILVNELEMKIEVYSSL